MSNFENEWYKKGYDDGFADAINNLELNDILEHITSLSDVEKEILIKAIKTEEK